MSSARKTLTKYRNDILREHGRWLDKGLPPPVFFVFSAGNEAAGEFSDSIRQAFPNRFIDLGPDGPGMLPLDYDAALSSLKSKVPSAWTSLRNVAEKNTAKVVVFGDSIEVLQIDAAGKRGSVHVQQQTDKEKLDALCAALDSAEGIAVYRGPKRALLKRSHRTSMESLLHLLLQRPPSKREVNSVLNRHR